MSSETETVPVQIVDLSTKAESYASVVIPDYFGEGQNFLVTVPVKWIVTVKEITYTFYIDKDNREAVDAELQDSVKERTVVRGRKVTLPSGQKFTLHRCTIMGIHGKNANIHM